MNTTDLLSDKLCFFLKVKQLTHFLTCPGSLVHKSVSLIEVTFHLNCGRKLVPTETEFALFRLNLYVLNVKLNALISK